MLFPRIARRLSLVLATALLSVAAVCAPAQATTYDRLQRECGTTSFASGSRSSGGDTYVACTRIGGVQRDHIRVYDAAGNPGAVIPVVGGAGAVSDVAASADGQYLYIARGFNIIRMHREGAQYVASVGWKLQPYVKYGIQIAPRATYLDVDRNGFIYVADGVWARDGAQNTVAKYAPDGTPVARAAFGDFGGAREPGTHRVLAGIDVTDDGADVWVAETSNSRIQRWRRQLDGSYRSAQIIGNTTDEGLCGTPYRFAAPYDVAIGPDGDVYVVNTSCYLNNGINGPQVHRYSSTGAFREILHVSAYVGARAHGIAVDARGGIYLGQPNVYLRPQGAAPPVGDVTAPDLRAATLPATTQARDVDLRIDATDAVGVTQMRIANEDVHISTRPWIAYGALVRHALTAGTGGKGVTVQVRDAAGNESQLRVATTTVLGVAVDELPIVRGVTIPAQTANRTIDVMVDASDDRGIVEMRLATEAGEWRPWQNWTARVSFELTAGAGTRGVYVQVRDAAGQLSNIVYRTTVSGGEHDTVPVLRSVTLPATTATRDVTLRIDATDPTGVTHVRIANEGVDITTRPWLAHAALVQHVLSAGAGAKAVSVQVRNAKGYASTVLVARTTLAAGDAQDAPPTVASLTFPDWTEYRTLPIEVAASDDRGVTEMRLATEAGVWGAWQPYETRVMFTLTAGTGKRGVYVQVRDAAGQLSNILYRITTSAGAEPVEQPADRAPIVHGITLPNPTRTRQVAVGISATDDGRVTEMRLATEAGVWGGWQVASARTSFLLTAGAGLRGVYVQVRDDAGQLSNVVFARTLSEGIEPVVGGGGAPTVRSLVLPALTPTQLVTVRVDATGGAGGVTSMRLANEDGRWGAWRVFGASAQHLLTARAMTKGVYVQVRDAAGTESPIVFRTTLCTPCTPPLAARMYARSAPVHVATRRITGTLRREQLTTGGGTQHVDLSQRDRRRDTVHCGSGFDTVLMRAEDRAVGCERVVIVRDTR